MKDIYIMLSSPMPRNTLVTILIVVISFFHLSCDGDLDTRGIYDLVFLVGLCSSNPIIEYSFDDVLSSLIFY